MVPQVDLSHKWSPWADFLKEFQFSASKFLLEFGRQTHVIYHATFEGGSGGLGGKGNLQNVWEA